MSDPIPGTWGAVTRSTKEEFRAFRASLDRLYLTPERLATFIEAQLRADRARRFRAALQGCE